MTQRIFPALDTNNTFTGTDSFTGALNAQNGGQITGTFSGGPAILNGDVLFGSGRPWADVKAFGAKGDAVKLLDGAITTGTANFSSASAVFTTADVGKLIEVINAGTSGAALITTILSITDANHVVLNKNATNTVTAAFTWYGTDDNNAINSAASSLSTGGIVYFPPSHYMSSQSIAMFNSGVIFRGSTWGSADIIFAPTAAISPGNNNTNLIASAISTFSARLQVASAIALNATSFTAQNASDAATLNPGDWVFISETDVGSGNNIVISDWVQVLSVSSTTVNVTNAFRQNFPVARTWTAGSPGSGTAFQRVTNIKENQGVEYLHLWVPYLGGVGGLTPGIYAQLCRNFHISNVVIDSDGQSSFNTFQTQGIYLEHVILNHGRNAGSEFSSTTNLDVTDSDFGSYANQFNNFSVPGGTSFTVDFGTAFFNIHNNHLIGQALGALFTAVYNGSFMDNKFDFVNRTGGLGAVIVSGAGVQGVSFINNSLGGGTTGSGSVGIGIGDTSGYTVNIQSHANIDLFNFAQVGVGYTTARNWSGALGQDAVIYTQGGRSFVTNGNWQFTEGTGVAGCITNNSGVDSLCADSGTHTLQAANNGGGFGPLLIVGSSYTFAQGNKTTTVNSALTTDALDSMTFGETTAATSGTLTNLLANQSILHAATLSGSTATPLEVEQAGITATTGPPIAQFESTWNNASLVGQGLVLNVTNTSSAAGSLLENLRVGNATQWSVDKAGNTIALGTGRAKLEIADQGTACANGNIALSAGWGTTAATTAAAGQGQTCQWTITASGTGQSANPTITWTLPSTLPSGSVVCSGQVVGGTQTSPATINNSTLSASAPVFTYNGTPTAAATLFVLLRCGP